MKIRKSVSRRFKITPSGKVIGRKSFARHLRAKKRKRRLRDLKRRKQIKGADAIKITKLLGKGISPQKKAKEHGQGKENNQKKKT